MEHSGGTNGELLQGSHLSIVLNKHFEVDGTIVFREACKLGCEGVVSKRIGSPYRQRQIGHLANLFQIACGVDLRGGGASVAKDADDRLVVFIAGSHLNQECCARYIIGAGESAGIEIHRDHPLKD